MKRLSVVFAALLLCLWYQTANAANIKDFPRVAVMNFGNKAVMSQGLRDTDFSAASEYAIYQLAACGWFDLVDYEQFSTIAKMHSVNMSGLVDPATAVAVGKFAGAQFMVVGNLTGLTTKENTVGYQHGDKGGLGANEHVVTANVAMRIVDIETGRIVCAGLGKGSSTSSHVEVVFKKYRKNKVETEQITDRTNEDISASASGDGNASMNETSSALDLGDISLDGTLADGTYEDTSAVNPEINAENTSDIASTSGNAAYNTSRSHERTRNISYEREELDYKITIGTVEVSDIQVRNAISKAVRDCIYGNMGLMTTLNGGKKLKIKTGF